MLSNYEQKPLTPAPVHASTMDLTTTNAKTPDTDTETPPQTQPIRSLSFTNGSLKPHHPHLHHHYIPAPAPPTHPTVVSYKECLKNHAASLGGYALDGCGEFMPSPTTNASDPTSLKCAACGCHRNFHRRRHPDDSSTTTTPLFLNFHHPSPPSLPLWTSSQSASPSPSDPPSPSTAQPVPPPYYASAPHMLLALGNNLSPPSDHHHQYHTFNPTVVKPESNPSGRKRHRTKFSQEQKEKMYVFSEKMGWTMSKSDERMVAEFCNEIGVRRGVLKVWMHNNKHTIGKIRLDGSSNVNKKTENGNDGRVGFETNGYNIDSKIGINSNEGGDGVHYVHGLTNGSSSSS